MPELESFKRVNLQPGEMKTVSVSLKAQQLAYWDEKNKAFAVESEPEELLVGSSSKDIHLETEVSVQ